MSNIFNKHYKKYDSWYDKHKFAFLSELSAIKKAIPSSGRGLEIGVGTGRFASALGISTGIDISEKMLAIAQRRGVSVRRGCGEKIPFPDSSFGYVAIIITLCFVKDAKTVLKESARVLKKKGKIIIGIIDKMSFLGKAYQSKKSIFYKHAKFFSVKKAAGLLKETGFRQLRYYQTISVLPGEMRKLEKPRKGFGRGGFVVISAMKR